jgi:hypothetical protein
MSISCGFNHYSIGVESYIQYKLDDGWRLIERGLAAAHGQVKLYHVTPGPAVVLSYCLVDYRLRRL